MSRDTGPSPDTRLRVLSRDGWACISCGTTAGLQLHHRRPRGMGGTRRVDTNSPVNLVALCVGCHGWVESHRVDAGVAGLLVSQVGDPAGVPVLAWGRWVLLTPDATYQPYGSVGL